MAFGGITGKSTTNWTNEEILSATTAQSLKILLTIRHLL